MMEEFFGKYGSIEKSKLLPKNDRFNGKYWVALDSAEAVDKALEEIGSETEIGGQTVSVVKSEVRVRKPRYQDKSKQTLFVGNLSWRVEDWQLEDFFMQFGDIEQIRLIKDMETGRSRGFGFVTFSSEREAQAAMQANGEELDGRSMSMRISEPQ